VLPAPVDPLSGWSTVRELPYAMLADHGGAGHPSVSGYTIASPNSGVEATDARGRGGAGLARPA
jgi:hypothetical protein